MDLVQAQRKVVLKTVPVQGLYRRDCVKLKDFSRTSKTSPTVFKGLKLMKNTDLHVKILLLKC